jgi:AMP nucleosidase
MPEEITREIIGVNLLERYTGSELSQFQPYILLTNFDKYVEAFAKNFNLPLQRGSAMTACHNPQIGVSIINFGVGSPVAALIAELLSLIHPKATLMLGMCGGLRDGMQVGDYFNPVAAIREEGTSMAYMPPRSPSLSSFVIQRYVCEELERNKIKYYNGVIHTTNVRYWEFKETFKENLAEERAQAIDMECATLFTVGFAYKVAIGALMLITDLPLTLHGIKTKASANKVFEGYASNHLQMGINILSNMRAAEAKGFGYQF